MSMINPFPTIDPVYLIYFFGGAAFLFLSFSIGTKNMKESNLRIADSMWLLATFGLIQGVREWLEIYPLLEGVHLGNDEIFEISVISVVLLVASFLALLQFGLSLSLSRNPGRERAMWTAATYSALCVAWLFFIELRGHGPKLQIVRQVQLGARDTVGLFGGLATSFAMTRYSNSSELKSLPRTISRNFFYAGIVFGVYAFLTTTFFSTIASEYVPYSKEVFRGAAAVLIAYFIVKALNIFDVETRRKVESQARELAQAEKMASLGRLAVGIAHEMNNPLTNASLGIQLLRKKTGGPGKEATDEQLGAVERNIDRAAAIAQELLQFPRQQETEFLPVNINDVVAEALAQLRHRLGAVVVEQDLSPVPEVMGDRLKLGQVFVNVLSNALEAMPNGGRITVSTSSDNGAVEARITDTGTGIAEANLPKVFDPFFTTKEIGSGTGLGLYLCYNIIKQHHGVIEIESAVGRGTTVTIKIPAKE